MLLIYYIGNWFFYILFCIKKIKIIKFIIDTNSSSELNSNYYLKIKLKYIYIVLKYVSNKPFTCEIFYIYL